MYKEIENNIYKVVFYGNTRFIEAERLTDLYTYLVEQEIKGFPIQSVTHVQLNGTTPRIAYKTNSDYKKIKKELLLTSK